MPTSNLPSLHKDGPFAELRDYGIWAQVGGLSALASALRVGTDAAKADDIKSIPDAWAQIQVFQQALLDPTHEMHADVRSQWRGLLALMALQPEFKTVYDLHVSPITLSEQDGPARKLRRVLRDLEPRHTLVKNPDAWNTLAILYFQERSQNQRSHAAANEQVPAALISPVALAAAGRSRAKLKCKGVPWMTDGLTDPLDVRGLTARHYEILAKFLDTLLADLHAQVGQAPNRSFTSLAGQLDRFAKECEARVSRDNPLGEVDLGLRMPSALYAALGKTTALDPGRLPDGYSDRRLQVRPEFRRYLDKTGLKGAILFDPDEPDDEEVTIWKGYTLSAARDPKTFAAIQAEATSEGWLVLAPDDLFTRELVRFDEKKTEIPAHGRRGFESCLMPFSPLVLLLLGPDELAATAQMAQRSGECVVSVDLPLLDTEGRVSAKRHKLTRRYGPDAVKNEEGPGDVSVWPNFRSRDWHWNFLKFQYLHEYHIQTRFGLSAEFIAADAFGDAGGHADRVRRLREWASADALEPDSRLFDSRINRVPATGEPLMMQRLRFTEGARAVAEMQRLPAGIEAIFFARRMDGQGKESARPVGLALVALKSLASNSSEAPRVAVDFGTTNTVAYEGGKGESRTPVSFESRVLLPIKTETAGRNLSWAYTSFFPLRQHEMPFPTVVRRQEYQGELTPDVQRQLKDGHREHGFSDVIFFMPNFGEAPALMDEIKEDRLVFNIKWASNEKTKQLAQRFLRQMMMMVAAELAAKGRSICDIEWKFSFPQAFSNKEKQDLENVIRLSWTELFGDVAKAHQGDGSSGKTITAADKITMRTESSAAARYFMYDAERGAAGTANTLMLMLDIGGGTTDIALWYKNEMRWRGSFRLAGGDFFTRYLANNPDILTKIDFAQVASSIKPGEPESAANFTELFINAPSFSKRFESTYPTFSMEPTGAGLRQCATAALGGLMHYMGLVLYRLQADGIVKPEHIQNMTVAFAGRGSVLFRQFNVGEKYKTELTQIVRMAVAAATGQDPGASRTDSQFSLQPKHEVARGLLIEREGSDEPDSAVAPIGEPLTFIHHGGQTVSVTADQDLHVLADAKEIEALPLEEFKNFLVSLRKLTGVGIDLESEHGEAMRIIRERVDVRMREGLANLKVEDDEVDVQFFEPPFIMALRELITLMSQPLHERDAILTVKEKLR